MAREDVITATRFQAEQPSLLRVEGKIWTLTGMPEITFRENENKSQFPPVFVLDMEVWEDPNLGRKKQLAPVKYEKRTPIVDTYSKVCLRIHRNLEDDEEREILIEDQ